MEELIALKVNEAMSSMMKTLDAFLASQKTLMKASQKRLYVTDNIGTFKTPKEFSPNDSKEWYPRIDLLDIEGIKMKT